MAGGDLKKKKCQIKYRRAKKRHILKYAREQFLLNEKLISEKKKTHLRVTNSYSFVTFKIEIIDNRFILRFHSQID